jgi:cytochrome c2
MTKDKKKETIESLCYKLKAAMLVKLDKIPDHWQEAELRQYMSDKAQQFNPTKMVMSGMRRYKKDVRENGL